MIKYYLEIEILILKILNFCKDYIHVIVKWSPFRYLDVNSYKPECEKPLYKMRIDCSKPKGFFQYYWVHQYYCTNRFWVVRECLRG